jgi:hypothetical protein
MYYLCADETGAAAVEAEVFSKFTDQVALTDPDAIAPDGTIIGRNAGSGELEPDATRTTGYYGAPQPAVQGWFYPVPDDETLQVEAPELNGVEAVEHLNPWPVRMMGNDPAPLPEWVQTVGSTDAYPLGMMVTHEGLDYRSTMAANVWAPSPESNFWDVVPPLPPRQWKAPTGSMDSYAQGDRVTHTYSGRTETLWESNIPANTTEPGSDGVYDRYWAPVVDVGGEIKEWIQPIPGTAATPYDPEVVVLAEGKKYRNTVQLNVWPPTGPGAYGWALDEPTQARDELGRFVADDPATPEDEAWV